MGDKHAELTGDIIGAFYDVYNDLGYGFLERVYENALTIELKRRNLHVIQQKPINVYYHGHVVGEYYADVIMNELVILEIKATRKVIKSHEAQLLNYLKATPYEVGLLLNFGMMPKCVRKVYDNRLKPHIQPH